MSLPFLYHFLPFLYHPFTTLYDFFTVPCPPFVMTLPSFTSPLPSAYHSLRFLYRHLTIPSPSRCHHACAALRFLSAAAPYSSHAWLDHMRFRFCRMRALKSFRAILFSLIWMRKARRLGIAYTLFWERPCFVLAWRLLRFGVTPASFWPEILTPKGHTKIRRFGVTPASFWRDACFVLVAHICRFGFVP